MRDWAEIIASYEEADQADLGRVNGATAIRVHALHWRPVGGTRYWPQSAELRTAEPYPIHGNRVYCGSEERSLRFVPASELSHSRFQIQSLSPELSQYQKSSPCELEERRSAYEVFLGAVEIGAPAARKYLSNDVGANWSVSPFPQSPQNFFSADSRRRSSSSG
jgi:hypothetical protein